ncbi:helix-turn-helix domain-containing protein [Natrinema sp. 1APR25-10V2]|uniref:helix-turn-helix domain-containing protein n=1 Tax=Natrinema sp. 1APR25-10V2 TaxID=2951081 RepID=UPI0028764C22|nr:helix-turn-helix domain-containing protein [Natrinema sp. 1APR25-10V2]MDS0474660.1 helix-turn-helix domain-containing protein [Natrinema sp. 1APR25-10V2]
MGSSNGIDEEDVLSVFDHLEERTEPLTAEEVADATGCSQRVAHDTLDTLTEQGHLKSKQFGERIQAWWRPSTATGQSPDNSASDNIDTPTHDYKDRTRIERILEASPVSLVVVDPSGEIVFANRRAEETLGLEHAEITSRTYRQPDWNIYYDDGTPVPVDEHPVTRVLQTKEPDFGFEHWIQLPDGTERWLSSNSAPVLNDDGGVEFVVVGFEDATPLKEREDKLTSEKRRVLELYSEQLFQPFLDAADGEIQIAVDEVVDLPNGKGLQYITATGISAKALTNVFEQHPSVLDIRLLQSASDHCRLEIHVKDPTVPLVFADLGGEVTSLLQNQPDKPPTLTGELPGDVPPRTAVQAAREAHSDIELESQELRYSPRLLYDIVADELTERQFAALQTAYYGGYFDTPRTSTGDELANRLDITRQTFNHHLRRAERTVLHQLFEASGKGAL